MRILQKPEQNDVYVCFVKNKQKFGRCCFLNNHKNRLHQLFQPKFSFNKKFTFVLIIPLCELFFHKKFTYM